MKKIELVITGNNILQEEIGVMPKAAGISYDTYYVKSNEDMVKFLEHHKKIDLLIIDYIIEERLLSSIIKISKTIINMLGNNMLAENDTSSVKHLNKPFRIKNLIDVINYSRSSSFVFEVISQGFLFDEEFSVIRNTLSSNDILLTERENRLIAHLLLSKNFSMTKEEILNKIWGYSSDSETGTLETHISRLKNKLPDNILISKDGVIKINNLRRTL